MNINNLQIVSFDRNGPVFVEQQSIFSQLIIQGLMNNIKSSEDIKFCVMLSGQGKNDMPFMGGENYGFNVLASLADDIIAIQYLHYFKSKYDMGILGKRSYISLDHIEINNNNLDALSSSDFKLISKNPDQSITNIRYPSRFHNFIMPYFEQIEVSIKNSQKGRVDFLNELERLSALRAHGAITEEEFVLAKRKLLGYEK